MKLSRAADVLMLSTPLTSRHSMIHLTHEPLDTQAILRSVESDAAGAVVLFLGTTRGVTDGRETASLDYECYPEMAEKKLAELEQIARERWPVLECAVVHRLGHLEVREASVAVAVSTAHREAAFECGKWLIDTIKEVVPIWKQENWTSGESEWVHPGVESLAPKTAPPPETPPTEVPSSEASASSNDSADTPEPSEATKS